MWGVTAHATALEPAIATSSFFRSPIDPTMDVTLLSFVYLPSYGLRSRTYQKEDA